MRILSHCHRSAVFSSLLRMALVACLIGALSPGLACNSFDPRKVAAESALAEHGRFLDWNGRSIYYVEKGQGEPLILIHGFGSSHFTWSRVMDQMSQHYRVIAPDLLGFGYSDKPDVQYNMDLFTRQIVFMMRELKIDSAYVGGNSMGGRITLHLAYLAPQRVKKMLLLDAAGYDLRDDDNSRPFLLQLATVPCLGEGLSAFQTRGQIRGMTESAYANPQQVTDETVEANYRPLAMPGGSRAPLSLLRGGFQNPPIAHEIPSIEVPALVLWGAEDTWIPLEHGERMHRELPNSELAVLEGVGHVPQEEAPEQTAREMLEFLEN